MSDDRWRWVESVDGVDLTLCPPGPVTRHGWYALVARDGGWWAYGVDGKTGGQATGRRDEGKVPHGTPNPQAVGAAEAVAWLRSTGITVPPGLEALDGVEKHDGVWVTP